MNKVFGFAHLIGELYDGLLLATASSPLLPQINSTAKAARLLVAISATIFLAGFGSSMAINGYLGLPGRVAQLESTMYIIAQDICVIRAATENLDAVQCLRSLDR
jgi:hypothetical protein